MQNLVEVTPLDELEADLAEPCIVKGCPNEAAWFCWVSHTKKRGCPGTGFVCDDHKEQLIQGWVEMLALPGRCAICLEPVGGTLEDNLRLMPL